MPNPPVLGLETRDRCLVMGVVNVTPDSFSDGGRWLDPQAAISRGRQLLADGADILDVGGESTRPGAEQVDAQEQSRRLLPVIEALAADGAVISVDTMSAAVAARALAAGAAVVNDVSGGLADPAMYETVAAAGAPYVMMHWRGHSAQMNSLAIYDDVPGQVCGELAERLSAFQAAGGRPGQVILDPGLGFAKTAEHNWQLLRGLDRLGELGRPVLVGGARKRFLGELLARHGRPSDPLDRDDATAALTAVVASQGAWGVRVHDVRPSADAVRVVAAIACGGVG